MPHQQDSATAAESAVQRSVSSRYGVAMHPIARQPTPDAAWLQQEIRRVGDATAPRVQHAAETWALLAGENHRTLSRTVLLYTDVLLLLWVHDVSLCILDDALAAASAWDSVSDVARVRLAQMADKRLWAPHAALRALADDAAALLLRRLARGRTVLELAKHLPASTSLLMDDVAARVLPVRPQLETPRPGSGPRRSRRSAEVEEEDPCDTAEEMSTPTFKAGGGGGGAADNAPFGFDDGVPLPNASFLPQAAAAAVAAAPKPSGAAGTVRSRALLERYSVGKLLGVGAFGSVFQGRCRATKAKVAVKAIEDPFHSKVYAQRAYREAALLSRLQHRHVVPLLDVVHCECDGASEQERLFLVFPCIPQTLEQAAGAFSPAQKKACLSQLLDALAYLHDECQVVHRDVKPANVLVDRSGSSGDDGAVVAYLADFGSARTVGSSEGRSHADDAPNYVQTLWYRAPEVLLGSSRVTAAADMWSYGCVAAEVATGAPVLPGNDAEQQMHLVLGCTGLPPAADVARLHAPRARALLEAHHGPLEALPARGDGGESAGGPEAVEALLLNTLNIEGHGTRTAEVMDPGLVALVARCLVFCAEERVRAAEAKGMPWFAGAEAGEPVCGTPPAAAGAAAERATWSPQTEAGSFGMSSEGESHSQAPTIREASNTPSRKPVEGGRGGSGSGGVTLSLSCNVLHSTDKYRTGVADLAAASSVAAENRAAGEESGCCVIA